VTGDPAPPLTVAHALLAAAQAQLGLPALGLGVAATWPPLSPLPMGSAAHIGAVIESDDGPRPADVGIPAEMRSVALPWEDAQIAALSNLPEAVTRPCALAAAAPPPPRSQGRAPESLTFRAPPPRISWDN
jgi:hypothetical protein